MITVDQALAIVLASVEPLGSESVRIDQALGRVLAEDIVADCDLPPFDRARMDGYALIAADVVDTPATLSLIGEIPAGQSFEGTVSRGNAVKIFTGAPIPLGANAVQKVEVTESDGATVTIKERTAPGQFITPRASEVKSGDTAARKGEAIGPAVMAVLASFGYSSVRVAIQPKIAVISTGSELVEVAQKPVGAQIRNSNTFTIASYASQAGARIEILGIVPDRSEDIVKALEAAASHDLVITSGGVSMGDYDLVKAVLLEMGANVSFDKVSIRPGKPTVFARRERTYFFGLPGNPVSTSVTFNVFVRPAIRKMLGAQKTTLPTVTARASCEIRDGSTRRSYLPARAFISDKQMTAEPLKWGGSSDFVAFMNANGLIVVPEDVHLIPAGSDIELMLLNPF